MQCAYHKYTFKASEGKKLIADLASSNERVRKWEIHREGKYVFKGFQQTGEKLFFYAVANQKISSIDSLKSEKKTISIVNFTDQSGSLEIEIGFSTQTNFINLKLQRYDLQILFTSKFE